MKTGCTRRHIWSQARRAIRRSNDLALEVAKRLGVAFNDVKNSFEFRLAVANEIRQRACHLQFPEFTSDNVEGL